MTMSSADPIVKLPQQKDQSYGSHAVTLMGYDLSRQLFIAKNSFGKEWGSNGYFWIPFEYIRTESFEKWCFDINTQKQSTSEKNITDNTLFQKSTKLYRI